MRRTSTREVYRNAWMSVREDTVVRDDGSAGLFGVVDKADFALIVPVEDNGDFWLVEQFRYPIERRVWEFPQGSWPQAKQGTAQQLARAELREETGLDARIVEPIGHVKIASGFCSQGCDVYLARGLSPGRPQREASESDMRHARVGRDHFMAMIADGHLVDAASLAAFTLYTMRQGQQAEQTQQAPKHLTSALRNT